ncbi:hypothetical protein ES319_A02G183700v1 [Gossypium barbadense]|uniref:Uncharacterized protein n=2 Tax=Gossypium TaxID=3633 RepID=A0A5J5WR10_GOSBA|nr:hypothetical protein ES319_A02G183700v1 [Gossypium barbadense]TYH29170.1 hypothetical protein ES288_A02G203000v1 [Gossypium darwinii]
MNSVWALLASIALIRTTLYNYLPEKLRLYISARFEEWTRRFNTDETMVFKDYQSSKMNQLFQAANLYLGESLPTISIPRVTVEKTENVRNLTFSMEKNTEMIDVYENIPMKWKYFSDYSQDFVLQNLLLSTANRSILVIEDIDCSIKLQNRESGIEQPIKYQQQNKLLPKVKVSPAEVAGELMKTRDPKASTEGLIKHLEEKLIADGNSEVSPKHHSSLSQTSNCQVHKSSISLPLACNGASMDNVKSPGPKPDVSVKSKLTADGEGDNNFEKTDLVRDRSSRHNILQVIEDMEKELLSYKEAIIALQKKSCGTLNKLAGIKATI